MYKISAQCNGLDPEKHKNLETTSTFPVARGEAISVTCKDGTIQLFNTLEMTCLEGTEFSHIPCIAIGISRLILKIANFVVSDLRHR